MLICRSSIVPWAMRFVAAFLFPLIAVPAVAQPTSRQASGFAVSPPLSSLPADETEKPPDAGDEVKTIPMKIFRFQTGDPDAAAPDPVVQSEPPPASVAPPSLSFAGLSNQDNLVAFGFRGSPPDTVGDVGPNHYVQMVNLLFRVFDKAGNPLTAPLKVSSIFAPLGAPCGDRDDGDPIVLYDPLADRWLLSQFCTVLDPFNHQVIAISQTPDPSGPYFLYDFRMPNIKFNDYPKFGVWTDAYYMTDNQFNQPGTTFLGTGVFAFDRAKMLAGDQTASYIYFDVENGNPEIGGMLPADIDGLEPPPIGTPGLFSCFIANEFGAPADALRLWEFRPDFKNPAASSFTELPESPVAVAAFDPRSPAGRDDIEQPPPATSVSYLDAISDGLMFRLQYRNFGTHESLVVNHTVNVSGVAPVTAMDHQAGVRYYELRRPAGGAFEVHEQATFAPDSHNRWMGSAAMDGSGNLAVAYSASSSSLYPSIHYAGRLASDPPNGLFQGENMLICGTGVQTDTRSRWGDYSGLSVDPVDDCTFWFTSEYYTAASQASSSVGWLTHIGTFSLPGCTPAESGRVEGTVRDALSGLPIPGATVQTTNGFIRIADGSGSYSMTMAVRSYDMVASAPSYVPATAGGVSVVNGGTTVQDFFLTPIAILRPAPGEAVTAEGCGAGNGAMDPGETVTVSLPVRNVGTTGTANLIATLLSTDGVTSPGPAQSYGVVTPGGPAVARSFTFTASGACGGTLTATLHLRDGDNDLGTASYTFTLGTLNPSSLTATASSGDLSEPIPDLSTAEASISVPDIGAVTDVNVRLRLDHAFDGDLVISLIGPDGTEVVLSNRRGGGGDNFGRGAGGCGDTPTIFDDSAGAAIASGNAPFAGTFRPESPLSAFNGKSPAGLWRLRVSDEGGGDAGTIRCVQLEISRRVYVCCGTPGTPALIGAGSNVTGESCSAPNGAVDPDETVSVSFALVNAGAGDTTDLVATLLPAGGVGTPSPPQSYGVVATDGAAVTRTFNFVPSGVCGGTVTATLRLQDGATDLGTVSFPLRLGTLPLIPQGPLANAAAIKIPATGTSGAASPYPSTISVSGVSGTISRVIVQISGLGHTFPDDLDFLLVGPGGRKILLMSDAGGIIDLVDVNLTFDDTASTLVPDSARITSGTYRPTNYGSGDIFPAPAPGAPYASTLAEFSGTSPNGNWQLWVNDDGGSDIGSILGGWSLRFLTASPVCCSQPCSLTCPPPVAQGNEPGRCEARVAFASPVVGGSCGTVACAPPSGSVFPVGETTDVCTATTQSGVTSTCSFPAIVRDVQSPSVATPVASPAALWPPDHRMVDVEVTYDTADNCSLPSAISCGLSVASNEPVNGLGDGDKEPDWKVVDAHRVQLRAERSGLGSGRVYAITVTCNDQAGLSSSQTVTVNVPHD